MLILCPVNGEVTKLGKNSIDDVMGMYDRVADLFNQQLYDATCFFFRIAAKSGVLFINFYADWCRFSNLLEPIFAETAQIIKKEFPVSK